MLKIDLLPVLNAEATHLGVKPLDDRKWRDWIEENLVVKPKPQGRKRGENPLWEYPSGTTERALAVLRLKASGVKQFSALRLQLWLHGHELPPTRIKEDLESEFARLLKKHFFRNPWTFDARDPNPDAPEKIKRHKKKLQPVDPTLAAAGLKRGGKILPVGSYFGYASGILGLRFFPNPDFDEEAAKRWDPERYYTDPDYYSDPKLVRPYRVGMSCGLCHVGPSPIHPPADPTHPEFPNLSSTVGAQYLWMNRFFVYSGDVNDFLYQLVFSYGPGTIDTSLVATDYIANPRTMNSIYNLNSRLAVARRWGKETLKGGELGNKQIPGFFDPPDTSWSPRIHSDGAHTWAGQY